MRHLEQLGHHDLVDPQVVHQGHGGLGAPLAEHPEQILENARSRREPDVRLVPADRAQRVGMDREPEAAGEPDGPQDADRILA